MKLADGDVWIPRSNIYRADLRERHRQQVLDLDGIGWVDCDVIDFCMAHIQQQFSVPSSIRVLQNPGGLQSCLTLTKPLQYPKFAQGALQIINTHPKSGYHWVLLSTYGPEKNTCYVYDSLSHHTATQAVQTSAAAMVTLPEDVNTFTLKMMVCDKQFGSDCGVHAIANLVSIIMGIDPGTIMYARKHMRQHLADCMVAGKFTMFPHTKIAPFGREYSTFTVPVYCTCKLPETDEALYFECTSCFKWYHPECQGYPTLQSDDIQNLIQITCLSCKHNQSIAASNAFYGTSTYVINTDSDSDNDDDPIRNSKPETEIPETPIKTGSPHSIAKSDEKKKSISPIQPAASTSTSSPKVRKQRKRKLMTVQPLSSTQRPKRGKKSTKRKSWFYPTP